MLLPKYVAVDKIFGGFGAKFRARLVSQCRPVFLPQLDRVARCIVVHAARKLDANVSPQLVLEDWLLSIKEALACPR